jgi:hypothetical protein
LRSGKRAPGVAVSTGNDADDLAGYAVAIALELRAAEAGGAIHRGQVELRQRLVAHEPQRDVVGVNCLAGNLKIGAVVERFANRALNVQRLGKECRPIHRIDLDGPQRIIGSADDETLQREFGRPGLRVRLGERLPPRRLLGLGLYDVERRQRADFNRARLSVTSFVARSSEPRATSSAWMEKSSSQYAFRTFARVVEIVPRSWISEASRFSAVTMSCCRLVSMRNPRSSGCVSVSAKLLLNAGL